MESPRLRAELSVGVFCQRLLLWPGRQPLEDDQVLAILARPEPSAGGAAADTDAVTLALVKLAFASGDYDESRQLLWEARRGSAQELERLLRLPLWPDCSEELGMRRMQGRRMRIAAVGTTPLIIASRLGHAEAVRVLCEAGANVDRARRDRGTPLALASCYGHVEVARLLCEARADVEKDGPGGDPPLFLALKCGQLEVARVLCQAGADVDKLDYSVDSGDTPLLHACREGHPEVVRLLCEAGAELDKVGFLGDTPSTLASRSGHPEVARHLQAARLFREDVDLQVVRNLQAKRPLSEVGATLGKRRRVQSGPGDHD